MRGAGKTKVGCKYEECKICGYQKKTVEILPTGTTTGPDDDKNESPSTGGAGNYFLWLALLLVSGIGLAGMVPYGRRKKCIVNTEDGAVVSMISIDATASFCNIRPSRILSLHFVFNVVL